MITEKLYLYKENNKTLISNIEPTTQYTSMVRLIARSDEYLLTKDYENYVECIDINEDELSEWVEVSKKDIESDNEKVSTISDEIKIINQTLQYLLCGDYRAAAENIYPEIFK